MTVECFHCDEPILPGEARKYYYACQSPVHPECYLRPVIGSVAHIERRCSCFVSGSQCGDDPALTRRQAARAAVAAWAKQQGNRDV